MAPAFPNFRHSRRHFLLACALLATSCAPIAGDSLATRSSQPHIDPSDLAQRIHARVNEERRRAKLPALEWDSRLAGIGAVHSRDMARRNYLAHDSPEGHGFDHRYRQHRYTCEVRVGKTIYGGAENIALSRLYNTMSTTNGVARYDWNSADTIAQRTVDGWMKSPGHRKNILTPHWRREGIGIDVAPDNRVLVTQNFC